MRRPGFLPLPEGAWEGGAATGRRGPRAAVAVLLSLLLWPGGTARADAGTWALRPDGGTLYVLAAGQAAPGAIAVTNTLAAAQPLDLSATDLVAVAGGGFAPAPAGGSPGGAGAWVHLGRASVTVPAGGEVEVPFTVQVPLGVGAGEYDAAIVAAAPTQAASGGLGLSARAALALRVAVPQAETPVLPGQATTLAAGGLAVTVAPGTLAPGTLLTLGPAGGGVLPALPPLAGAVAGPFLVGGDGTVLAVPALVRLELPPGAPASGLFVAEFDPGLRAWLPVPTAVQGATLVGSVDRLAGVAAALFPAVAAFPDVAGTWAEGPVLALESLGVLSSQEGGGFRPQAPISRAGFAALLARGLHLAPAPPGELSLFTDAAAVPPPAAPDVAAAVAAGLLRGDGAGELDPTGPVTRAEAAVMAARVTGLAPAAAPAFSDAALIPPWAAAAVGAAAQAGLLAGYPDGTFRPLQPLTRAEAAALVLRLLRAAAA
jgi:hypothetical protein